jgi:alpha-L-fucosidase 2
MSSRLLAVTLASASFGASVLPASNAVERRDVEYTRYGDLRLALDASVPQREGLSPAVIVVHGGGWVRGDRRVDVGPVPDALTEAGFAWFSISYRLMHDSSQFGAAVEDVAAAIRFVKAHSAEYGVDPDRLALVGESAGGQLAAMAALSDAPDLSVRGVVGIYAPTDLAALAEKSKMVPQWVRESVRGTAWEQLVLAGLKQLSPIEHVRSGMPPFLLIHGTSDMLVPFEQSRAMCERIRSVGGSCELFPVTGGGHGIRWWESSPALSRPYKHELLRWLGERLS